MSSKGLTVPMLPDKMGQQQPPSNRMSTFHTLRCFQGPMLQTNHSIKTNTVKIDRIYISLENEEDKVKGLKNNPYSAGKGITSCQLTNLHSVRLRHWERERERERDQEKYHDQKVLLEDLMSWCASLVYHQQHQKSSRYKHNLSTETNELDGMTISTLPRHVDCRLMHTRR